MLYNHIRASRAALVAVSTVLLAACGGGGGGGGGSSNTAKSCSEQFNPDAAATTPEQCQPVYNEQCDSLGARSPYNASEPAACTVNGADGGVSAETVTVGGVEYVLLKPASGGKSGLYVGLHWRGGNGPTMSNNMRMPELAKARDLTVAVPTSPNYIFSAIEGVGYLHDWDYSGAPAVIAQVIADAKARNGLGNVPVVLAGVSSGVAAATRFYCEQGSQIDGLLLVASGSISAAESTACLSDASAAASKAASSMAVAVIQGTRDPAYEDAKLNYGHFELINGCDGSKTVALNEQVDIEYSRNCGSGHGTALVSVKDSGHNWPGMDRPIPENPVTDNIPAGSSSGAMSIFGRVSFSFDATLQGYDLVRNLD
ncbi:MAG TPA: hypothetical protein VLI06_20320 [Solimonas sp.]|nr:hypothetical protein [Solimonas sp.]